MILSKKFFLYFIFGVISFCTIYFFISKNNFSKEDANHRWQTKMKMLEIHIYLAKFSKSAAKIDMLAILNVQSIDEFWSIVNKKLLSIEPNIGIDESEDTKANIRFDSLNRPYELVIKKNKGDLLIKFISPSFPDLYVESYIGDKTRFTHPSWHLDSN